MKNTRKQNVVVWIITNENEKKYFKTYTMQGQIVWTKEIDRARKWSIGEARRFVINCLYLHRAGWEVLSCQNYK